MSMFGGKENEESRGGANSRYNKEHSTECNYHRNMHMGNPEYRYLMEMRSKKMEILKTRNYKNLNGKWVERKVPLYSYSKESLMLDAAALAIENSLRKEDRNGNPKGMYRFCDGKYHYESYGTDPYYYVIEFCPIHHKKRIANGDFTLDRGIL